MEQKQIDSIAKGVKVFGIVLGVVCVVLFAVSVYLQVR